MGWFGDMEMGSGERDRDDGVWEWVHTRWGKDRRRRCGHQGRRRVAGEERKEEAGLFFQTEAGRGAEVISGGILEVIDGTLHVAWGCGVLDGDIRGDEVFLEGVEAGLIEGLPAVMGILFHDLVEGSGGGFAFPDDLLHTEVVAEDFVDGGAAAADFGQEELADDPFEAGGEAVPDFSFLGSIEHAGDALDGPAHGSGVKGGDDEVAGFGG